MTDRIIRVLLADDHPTTRAGIRAILEEAAGIEVVGEAEDGAQVQQLVAELEPAVLLLDLVMPGPRPSEIEAWVRAHHPETVTLVLTAHDRDYYLSSMIEAGVAGFLTKEEPAERLVEAIRRACCGEILITEGQWTRAEHWHKEVHQRWETLTKRERQVLQLLVQGLDNATMAHILCVTEKTVAYHVANILDKLGVTSRLEAVVWVRTHLPKELYMLAG